MLKALVIAALMAAACPSIAQNADDTTWSAGSNWRIGSFEMEAAGVIGHIAARQNAAASKLRQHAITAQQAVSVQKKADSATALYKAARATCNADDDGHCRGDAVAAEALLAKAREVLP